MYLRTGLTEYILDSREGYSINKTNPRLPAVKGADQTFIGNPTDQPAGFVIPGNLPTTEAQGVHSLTGTQLFYLYRRIVDLIRIQTCRSSPTAPARLPSVVSVSCRSLHSISFPSFFPSFLHWGAIDTNTWCEQTTASTFSSKSRMRLHWARARRRSTRTAITERENSTYEPPFFIYLLATRCT
jgi:hypothetical protein